MVYMLNQRTRKLHIYGYCPDSRCPEYVRFNSESEAIAFAKEPICLCLKCEKKREKALRGVQ